MIEDYWFPWYPARFKADTMDLDPYQDGVYRRLIDHYMETKIGLPDSDAALARIAGIAVSDFVDKCGIIRGKFRRDEKTGRLMHKKCDAVIKDQNARSVLASKKAKKAAEAMWKKKKENQGHLFDVDATSIQQAMLDDATGQDRTGQDTTGKESSPVIPSNSDKTPPSPPSAGAGGFKKDSGEGAGASRPAGRPYHIEHHLSDEARVLAKRNAPGWEIHELFRVYDQGIADGKRTIPNSPNTAFPAWCRKYTKGKPPS